MAILVDTGVLYALADRDDAWHDRAVEWLDSEDDVLMVPIPVVPGVCHLLQARLGPKAERLFVESLARGELAVEALDRRDLARAAALLAKRPELGVVDATVVALAERLSVTRVATTDRRHFGSVRLEGGGRLELLP